MQTLNHNNQLPIYKLEPNEIAGNKNFRLYQFEGTLPNQSELLITHRKNSYCGKDIIYVWAAEILKKENWPLTN